MKKTISLILAAAATVSALLLSACTFRVSDSSGNSIEFFGKDDTENQTTATEPASVPTGAAIPYSRAPEIPEYKLPAEEFADDIEREASDIIDAAIEKAIAYVSVMMDDRHSFVSYAFDGDSDGYIAALDDSEKELYKSITAAADDLEDFMITDREYNGDLKKAYFALTSPIEFCRPDLASYTDVDAVVGLMPDNETTRYRSVSVFYFDPYKDAGYLVSASAIRHDAELLKRIVGRIVRFMPDGLTTYDKYYYLAAVLSERVFYDDRPANCYTAFGALVCGRAVCEGYASAYYLLCKEAGLWCSYRTGVPDNAHIWNMVKLESGIYNVDITWCDKADAYRYKWYENFVKTDAEFKSHNIKSGIESTGLPEVNPYE